MGPSVNPSLLVGLIVREVDIRKAVERAKREIEQDIHARVLPSDLTSFSQLHDYVDANGYGGAFEENAVGVEDVEFWNEVQDRVDAWLKAGRPSGDVETDVERMRRS